MSSRSRFKPGAGRRTTSTTATHRWAGIVQPRSWAQSQMIKLPILQVPGGGAHEGGALVAILVGAGVGSGCAFAIVLLGRGALLFADGGAHRLGA